MTPKLEATKSYGAPSLNSDGTWNVAITIKAKNVGDVDIENLQLTDVLTDASNFGTAYDPSTGLISAPTVTVVEDGNATIALAPNVNSSFDGDSNGDLLDGSSGILGVNDVVVVSFTVQVDPYAAGAPTDTNGDPLLQNLATASGEDPSGATVSDDTGGASGGPGSPIMLTPLPMNPKLEADKSFGAAIQDAGVFYVPVHIIIRNVGDVNLDNLQLEDKLSDVSNLGAYFKGIAEAPTVSIVSNASGEAVLPTVNASFDGDAAATLFDGTSGILGVGDAIEVTFVAEVDPAASSPIANTATASGEDPSGSAVTDDSGGESGGPGEPALADINVTLGIQGTKTFGTPVLNADGTVDVPVYITAVNTGVQDLTNLQITDDLSSSDNFGAAFVSVIDAPTVTIVDYDPSTYGITNVISEAPTVNGSFDGSSANATLFDGISGTLGSGDQVEVAFTVKLDPNASGVTDLQNTATVSGDGPGGTTMSDDTGSSGAHDAVNPGPGKPTPLTTPAMLPKLQSSKSFGTPVLNEDGTFDVEVTITGKNIGNVDIDNLQLNDELTAANNLGTAYDPSTGIVVAPAITIIDDGNSTTAEAPLANASFDGGSNSELLDGSSGVLGVNDEIAVVFTIRIDPNASGAPEELNNTATLSGQDPGGNEVSDLTGGDNGGPGEPVVVTPPLTNPKLESTKSFGTPILNADGTFDVAVTITTKNVGNVDMHNVQVSDILNASTNLGSAFTPSTSSDTSGGILSTPEVSVVSDVNDTALVLPSLDASFDGGSSSDLFDTTIDNVLGVGDEISVVFMVRVDPNAAAAPAEDLENTATVQGADPSGVSHTDSSGGASGGPGVPTDLTLFDYA
ncbi:hypothetical protein, partial [Tenacibaculum sp. UWU-22]|uniref:hypothetical protein n=1 Tax=Tenacibaculum sp. UWU-22 TaxID=3234187 RepID=UPI0034DADD74